MSHSFQVPPNACNEELRQFYERGLEKMRLLGHDPVDASLSMAGGPLADGGFAWVAVRHVWACCTRCDHMLIFDSFDANAGDPKLPAKWEDSSDLLLMCGTPDNLTAF